MPISRNRTTLNSISIIAIIVAMLLSTQACASKDWLNKSKELLGAVKEQSQTENLSLDELSLNDIGAAFKEALHIGSEKVTQRLGSKDGFNADPAIRIPLPRELRRVKKTMDKMGMSDKVDDFVVKLNRAAETATPKAKALFWQAIKDMTFKDARQIYEGPDDSATRYFQEKMSISLKGELQPVVDESLSQVGAIRSYDKMMGKYQSLPFVPDVKADVTGHVVDKAMAGIFHYIAEEEVAIRKDSAKRTTELLKKVFGRD